MTMDAVQFIVPGTSVTELTGQQTSAATGNFERWLTNEMTDLNDQLNQAEITVQQLAAGEIDNLHQIMISLERAKLSFDLALQVRNKLLESYQEIMRMQV